MRGRKPKPRRGSMLAKHALPRCPPHLSPVARKEWRRLATPLHEAGVLTLADRAALAAYCQTWARWVEAEEQLAKTPHLLKAPSGYVQQSPWLGIANRQLEIMGRYMAELGLTPAARGRVAVARDADKAAVVDRIEFVSVVVDEAGNRIERARSSWSEVIPAAGSRRIGCPAEDADAAPSRSGKVTTIEIDPHL